jgi:hypothetical protein
MAIAFREAELGEEAKNLNSQSKLPLTHAYGMEMRVFGINAE